MTGEHMYEMFTKASIQKMWPAGVEVYSSESQSSLSFSMSLNSFVTPFSAFSSYWNLVSPFLNSGESNERSCLSPAPADLKWETRLLVQWEWVLSPPLVKIPLKDASKLRHTSSRGSAAKVSHGVLAASETGSRTNALFFITTSTSFWRTKREH